jgi:integrase
MRGVAVQLPPDDGGSDPEWSWKYEWQYGAPKRDDRKMVLELAFERLLKSGKDLPSVVAALQQIKGKAFENAIDGLQVDLQREQVEEADLIRCNTGKWLKRAVDLHRRLNPDDLPAGRRFRRMYEDMLTALTFDEPATEQERELRDCVFDPRLLKAATRREKQGNPDAKLVKVAHRLLVTTADIHAFTVARQEAGASNAEINRELAALRRSFRLAVRAGRLVQYPHVPMLQERNTRRGFLEPDQIAANCEALPEEIRPIVKFAYATGWRTASEVLPLEWRNIDWAGRCIRLDAHTTKNGEPRVFPFTTELETILMGQLAEHERLKAAGTICPFVFHRNGERIMTFRTAWKNACKAAGCPGKLIHDMRRSAVRTFERAGVPRSVGDVDRRSQDGVNPSTLCHRR